MRKIGFIILALIFLSCESDPIEAGIETNIRGIVYDSQNDIPFKNLKIKVAEYKIHRSTLSRTFEFIQWIDSTYTDLDGHYNLNLETSGRGDHYRLEVEREIDVWTYYNGVIDISGIGKNLNLDLDFLHLYPINLVIELNDINHLPITGNIHLFPNLEDINTASGLVERIIYTDKHSDTRIQFSRKVAPNEYESHTVTIPASNTSELTTYNLTLNNSDFKPK